MMRAVVLLMVLAVAIPPPGADASQTDARLADRPLATRQELEELAARLAARNSASQILLRVRTRLSEGDFRRGDRIALEVQAESTLTDTFTVGARRELLLPPPTVGALSLAGVLRAELQDKMTEYIARFRQNPVVRAYPLIRLSIQGEVANAGVYAVPADGRLADAVMAAGGTTQYAETDQMHIERNGERIWEGPSFEVAIDALGLRDGDQIVVGGDRPGRSSENLRLIALIVSIAGGLYGLSRAF
ncbi:MAG: polysaccharide biosynthesis/export family protein [Gemmatimonadales bacterium]